MTTKRVEDLSVQELRHLLLEKRRVSRNVRLEHFRSTGQVSAVAGTLVNKPVLEHTTGVSEKGISAEKAPQSWLDRILLFTEILAIVGLVGMALNGLSTLKLLNREVVESFQQPALAPTPIIRAVVLPEGHTPPNGPNGAQPNEAEIPEHLRPLAQSLANVPIPTPANHQAIRIQIPAIEVDAPVVLGDGWEQLKLGVAQHLGTPNPGENGNIVLSGHNDIFGEVFRNLDRLQPGDTIILFTSWRQYTYIITGTKIVDPTAVEVMDPTSNSTVTLISCHPYLVDNHRIVVSAVLQNN
jgi:sortase A